jgi:hypothetical protein
MHHPTENETATRQRTSFPIGAGLGLLIGFGLAFLLASLWSPPPPVPGSRVEDDLAAIKARVQMLERETPEVTVHSAILVSAAETAVATALPNLVDSAYRAAAVDHAYTEDRMREDVRLRVEALVGAELERIYGSLSATAVETPYPSQTGYVPDQTVFSPDQASFRTTDSELSESPSK